MKKLITIITLGFIGCLTGAVMAESVKATYTYFVEASSDNPWLPKVGGWMRREKSYLLCVAAPSDCWLPGLWR